MKRINELSPLLAVVLIGAMLIGCHITAATPALAPTGARDSIDASANLALQPAHDFELSISTSIQKGKLQLTQMQLDAVNSLNALLNTADSAEQAYHASGANAAALNAAVAAVVAAFNNALSVFNSVTK